MKGMEPVLSILEELKEKHPRLAQTNIRLKSDICVLRTLQLRKARLTSHTEPVEKMFIF